MAEGADKESKTEEATEKKIRDSVDKGQLPFSKEVPVFASFLAILTFAIFFAQDSAMRLGSFLSIFLERADGWSLETRSDAMAIYQLVFVEIAKVVGVVILFSPPLLSHGLHGLDQVVVVLALDLLRADLRSAHPHANGVHILPAELPSEKSSSNSCSIWSIISRSWK